MIFIWLNHDFSVKCQVNKNVLTETRFYSMNYDNSSKWLNFGLPESASNIWDCLPRSLLWLGPTYRLDTVWKWLPSRSSRTWKTFKFNLCNCKRRTLTLLGQIVWMKFRCKKVNTVLKCCALICMRFKWKCIIQSCQMKKNFFCWKQKIFPAWSSKKEIFREISICHNFCFKR